jgi:hypothetical protein
MRIRPIRSVEVVIQQPVNRLFPYIGCGLGVGQLACVQVQQVMHPPPPRSAAGLLDQVSPGQMPDRPSRRTGRLTGQRRDGGRGNVGAGIGWQQPEQTRRAGIQLPVGQLERRRHRGCAGPAAIVIPQRLQPVHLIAELLSQLPGRKSSVRDQQRPGDPQRQRQPAAHPRQPGRRPAIGGDPVIAWPCCPQRLIQQRHPPPPHPER